MGYGNICSHFVDFLGSVSSHSFFQFSFLSISCQTRAGAPHTGSRISRTPQLLLLDNRTRTNLKGCTGAGGGGQEAETDSQSHREQLLLLGPSNCYPEAVVMALVVAFQDRNP